MEIEHSSTYFLHKIPEHDQEFIATVFPLELCLSLAGKLKSQVYELPHVSPAAIKMLFNQFHIQLFLITFKEGGGGGEKKFELARSQKGHQQSSFIPYSVP